MLSFLPHLLQIECRSLLPTHVQHQQQEDVFKTLFVAHKYSHLNTRLRSDFGLGTLSSDRRSLIVLVYLFVLPEHRRRGIGRQLIHWGKWI